jgi:hypothetical protein
MPVPFEVRYRSVGKKGKKSREVIGVLCPTVINQRLFGARAIPVSMGDAEVDWTKTTAGFECWNRHARP